MLGRNKKEGAQAPSPLPVNRTAYKMEKNVEMPAPHKAPGRKPLYPFSSMKVEDSFFVDLEEWKKRSVYDSKDKSRARRIDRLQSTMGGSARSYSVRNKQGKWKFTTRQQLKPIAGVRIWRIE